MIDLKKAYKALGAVLAVCGVGLGIFGVVGGIFVLYAAQVLKLPLSLPPLPILIGQGPVAMIVLCTCSFFCFKKANQLEAENASEVAVSTQNEVMVEEAEPLLPVVKNFPSPLNAHIKDKNKPSEILAVQDEEIPLQTNSLSIV